MTLLLTLIIGVVIGYLASRGPERDEDLVFLNIIFGIAGSLAGFSSLLLFGVSLEGLIPIESIIASIIGASIAVLIFNGLHRWLESHTNSTTPGGDL